MGYRLPNSLRNEFQDPIGRIFSDRPDISAKKAIEYINSINKGLVVTIGDMCTKSLLDAEFYPEIIIYDGKTQREGEVNLNLHLYEDRQAFNPPGWILQKAWSIIETAIAFSTSNNCRIAVRITGEEDLLIIPAITALPLGSVVIYGNPPITSEEGIVVVSITPLLKARIEAILKKFEFHEEYSYGNNNY